MKPRIKVLTLAVSDLERSLVFYREGMGFKTEGIIGQEYEHGAVVFFELEGGLVLALWPSQSLAADAKATPTQSRLGAVSIGYIVASKADVDALVSRAQQAGAVVTAPPQDRFWGGYTAYFHDPDGHLWEITWHPKWSVEG